MSNNKNDSLGDRMKTYERTTRNFLIKRTPIIIRLDGKAFHTFTKKLTINNDPSLQYGPFSHTLHNIMTDVMVRVCKQIQNAKFAYTQSDEISILLTDYDNIRTEQWFNGNIQKIASVSASMVTAHFNYAFADAINDGQICLDSLAMFDSRVFNLPKEEVTNYFIWRQNDASRNSVQMLGRHYFSHKQLHQKNNNQIQDMLMLEHNVNWNDLDTWKKRGTGYLGKSHTVDKEIPILTQDRNYIESLLTTTE